MVEAEPSGPCPRTEAGQLEVALASSLKMVEAEGIAPSSKENLAVDATGLFHVLF